MSEPSFINRGVKGLDSASRPSPYVSLKDGDTMDIVPYVGVEGIISFYQHRIWLDEGQSPIFPCLQTRDCPGCMINNKPDFRAMMPVKVKGVDDPKIYVFGKSVFRSLAEIESAMGTIAGAVLRIKRTGATATNTRYSVVPTGTRVSIPEEPPINVVEYIGPTDRNEIIDLLKNANLWKVKDTESETKAGEPWESVDD